MLYFQADQHDLVHLISEGYCTETREGQINQTDSSTDSDEQFLKLLRLLHTLFNIEHSPYRFKRVNGNAQETSQLGEIEEILFTLFQPWSLIGCDHFDGKFHDY